MSVMEWVVQELLKDSACCGDGHNCSKQHFSDCDFIGWEDVEVE